MNSETDRDSSDQQSRFTQRVALTTLQACMYLWSEERAVMRMIRPLYSTDRRSALDIGCGYGRYLKLLKTGGWEVTGVDVSDAVIEHHRVAGSRVLRPDEFEVSGEEYDLMLMSHFIEHFSPSQLLATMDMYLDKLRSGGHLVICTPTLSPRFYDDFDHVKPYSPWAIESVFAVDGYQIQYTSRHRLQTLAIRYRRRPRETAYIPAQWLQTKLRFNAVWALLFGLSLGLIGRRDGWMGLFRKMPPESRVLT